MEQPSPSAVYSSLNGKVVLVTGGASGIGEAIVEAFVQQGSRVLFLDIQDDAANSLVQRQRRPDRIAPEYFHCDLTNASVLESVMEKILRSSPVIDVLVKRALAEGKTAPKYHALNQYPGRRPVCGGVAQAVYDSGPIRGHRTGRDAPARRRGSDVGAIFFCERSARSERKVVTFNSSTVGLPMCSGSPRASAIRGIQRRRRHRQAGCGRFPRPL